MQPLVGLAPNLIGSFLLPFGACLFFKRLFRLETEIDLYITCGFGLLLVIINEFLQLIPIFGRTFDYLDILSSVVGVFLGHLYFRKLMLRRAFVSMVA
jgi:voltage-gated potassium channel Kch